WLWLALGYALFVWSSLRLIDISTVSPDMLVAAAVYLAAGALVRIIAGNHSFGIFALLGIALGFGFLAKAPVLALSVVFLALAFFEARRRAGVVSRVLLSVLMIAVIVGPYIARLSAASGKITTGESWRLNAAWYIDHIPRYHWQPNNPAIGTPIHSTRLLVNDPPLFEFDREGRGTYPIWFDPAYWFAGIQPHFSIKPMAQQTMAALLDYYDVFFRMEGPVLAICLALFLVSRKQLALSCDALRNWPLLLIVAAALGMYAVVHVEDRMIGAFVVILWMTLFAALPIGKETWLFFGRYAIGALVAVLVITLGFSMAGRLASHSLRELLSWYRPASFYQWQVAQELTRGGLRAGDKVAWLRPDPFTAKRNYWWARLAQLHIIAEIPAGQEDRFWSADTAKRAAVVKALEGTPTKALIATRIPPGFPLEGWTPLGQTGYYLYRLAR
ncbi:MAG: hypothetical protein JOZ22_26510, partial [Acidobacteriia bacterium]|nr:hypothetical protein [Terriglobia bacterium]